MALSQIRSTLIGLEKLKIRVEVKQGVFGSEIAALYNPTEIRIDKTVNWRPAGEPGRDVQQLQFTHGDNATLTLELFFDTFEAGTDVRILTNQIARLAVVQSALHRPPICQLIWGLSSQFFQGTLESLSQQFTLFLANGTPVRARLGCTFKEWRSDQEEALRQNLQSADVAKSYTVQRGDTLSGIAAALYDDPTLWRPIADANGITNPRTLIPGTVLAVPALSPGSTA